MSEEEGVGGWMGYMGPVLYVLNVTVSVLQFQNGYRKNKAISTLLLFQKLSILNRGKVLFL